MRKDMAKVITERPRKNYQLPSKKTGLRIHRYDPNNEYEDLPKRVPVFRHLDWDDFRAKSFRDLLSPLRQFLRSKVGQPWDQVYSEIRLQLDCRKTMDRHLLQHVKCEVVQNCYIGEDGAVCFPAKWYLEFYVHPRTRLLCRKKPFHRIRCVGGG